MTNKSCPSTGVQRRYRVRIALFLGCVLAVVVFFGGTHQCINTIRRLEVVESERDLWQRPSEIIQTLNLSDGCTVADLGSGAGYFALKLSPVVSKQGKVLAVDIRRLSLSFLWVRAWRQHQKNVYLVHGDTDDPHLPPGVVDAVLVVNTYHELAHPKPVLSCVLRSLVPGGRLVIVDRSPRSTIRESRNIVAKHHEVPLSLVEEELRQGGFEVVDRKDPFAEEPGHGQWWLLVARKP